MLRDKKILLIFLIMIFAIFVSKVDYDKVLKNKLGKVEGVSQEETYLKVVVFDVGQGDSIFIETPNEKQILIDGGPDNSLLEKLNKQMDFNDRFIDIIILTHPHADHMAGLTEVLKRFEVGQVWLSGVIHTSSVYLEFLNLVKEKNIPTKNIFACGIENLPGCTDEVLIDDVKLKILYPLENLAEQKVDKLNNTSIVIRVDYGENSFLLMGDAEISIEKEMMENFEPDEFKADVLKIGHHGSSDASGEEFLELVNPEYAVISVGEGNKYGHPSLRVIRRLERMEIRILRTDEQGDVGFVSDNKSLISSH